MIEGLDTNIDPRIRAALRCPCADCVLKRAEEMKPAEMPPPLGVIDRIAVMVSTAFSRLNGEEVAR